jgi:hypothetical protein
MRRAGEGGVGPLIELSGILCVFDFYDKHTAEG